MLSYSYIYAQISSGNYHKHSKLNGTIKEGLEEHNNALIKGGPYIRRQQFEEVERPEYSCPCHHLVGNFVQLKFKSTHFHLVYPFLQSNRP